MSLSTVIPVEPEQKEHQFPEPSWSRRNCYTEHYSLKQIARFYKVFNPSFFKQYVAAHSFSLCLSAIGSPYF